MDKNIEKMISENPKIDREALEKALLAGKVLADYGVTPKGYGLRIPYQHPVQGTVRSVQSGVRRGRRRK
jgi:hypothetical protein